MKNLKFISENTREQLDIKRSLFQEEYVNDFRPSAGASAVKSGALFEQVVQEKIQGLMGNKSFKLFSQPSFTDYMDMDRRADFMLLTKEHKSDQPLYIECKQLGNCESHIDKVVVWFNQIFFSTKLTKLWIIYDYNGETSGFGYRKIQKIKQFANMIQSIVQQQGKVFEFIYIEDLPQYL